MRLLTRTVNAAVSPLLVLGMLTLVGSSYAAAQEVCSGFDQKHTITKLGGPNALGPGGLQTRAELQAYFAAHADEIRSVLASRGLGAEVADALLAAVREGTGLSERAMAEGEQLRWMAYRKGGDVVTIENVCMQLSDVAPAFEITVPLVMTSETATADCTLEVTTDCQPGGTSSFHVRAAPGARVTLAGTAGPRLIIEDGDSTWTGPMETPYEPTHSFTVSNEAATTETVTTYTFLVPRQCVNLSLVGRSEAPRAGVPVTCSERHFQPVCPVPAPPSCSIQLDHTEVRRGNPVGYQVTGRWTSLDVELTRDGAPLAEPSLVGESGSFVLPQGGAYTVVGTATNEVGDTSSCRASVEMVGADWIARLFGAYLATDGDETGGDVFATTSAKSCPCSPGVAYGLDDGYGLGFSLERLFSERIGVEARGLYGWLDDRFWIGANGIGITDTDTVDHWDLSLGLNIHLTPNHALDWYLGPFVGYSDIEGYTSLAFDRSLEFDPKGAVTWGAQTGLDWAFGESPWSLHLGARYTRYTVDVIRRYTNPSGAASEQSGSLDIDPITAEFGVAYRF